jgi:hypothetical protein
MSPHVNALIYGEPGVGKTRLIGSADAVPQMRKVLILDVDGGALSVKDVYPNVERLRITNFAQLEAVHRDLHADASHGFQTVSIDTGTEAQKYSMAAIMRDVVIKAAEKGEARDPDVPSMREWGITQEQVRRVVRKYRDLPLNFFMTCHVKDDKDEKTGITKKAPDLPGKLARQIAGFFDVVLYMYSKEVVNPETKEKKELRLLMSSATERITAKDRTDKLDAIVQTCTMTHLYNTMTGEIKK